MSSPVILDTQLLVLLVVGMTSTKLIPKHRNLTEFTEDDYTLLQAVIGDPSQIVLLPNIVSETANLLRQHREPDKARISACFASLVELQKEVYIESSLVVTRREYKRLGVTDTAILEVSAQLGLEIVTADLDLYIAASTRGMPATNFNHTREDFGLL